MQYKEIPIQLQGSQDYARLCLYLLDVSGEYQLGMKRPMVIICPGGGYERTSDREAEPVAAQFLAMGYHAAVLRYSTAPSTFPTSLLELSFSVQYIKKHAQAWSIDTNHVFVMGFSAGGHLAASYGAFWNKDFISNAIHTETDHLKINGLILCYPVITSDPAYMHEGSFMKLLGSNYPEKKDEVSIERLVTKDFPKTFLWHTYTDQAVPVENSLLLAMALRKANVGLELHIYPEGRHGLSLADETTSSCERKDELNISVQTWISLLKTWLRELCR